MDLTWGKPVASADRWIGAVAGVVVDADRRASHFVIRRGLLRRRETFVPISHLDMCDPDAVYLSLPTQEFLSLAKAGRYGLPPELFVLGKHTPATLPGGLRWRLAGVRLSEIDCAALYVMARSSGIFGQTRLLPANAITDVSSQGIALNIDSTELVDLPVLRNDRDIERDLSEGLYESNAVSPVDLDGFAAKVTDGVVALEGNVRTSAATDAAVRLAAGIEGVIRFGVDIRSDWDVELEIADAIAGIEPGLSGSVEVQSQLGAVKLLGETPNSHLRVEVMQAARDVHGVRTVEDMLSVRAPAAEK